ncbi:MAG TPA: DUF3891 family protein [Candidatus Binatia bacterium]|jgi:hypothetical protein|nr:DUF3891 family protein [Candidatus Binatia bacterium]
MMVCPYNESHVLLVLQIDHSRIAGLLAAHWGNAEFANPSPYASMVLAAQEHDSGWWDWEIKPTVNEQGYPSDYIGSIKHLGQDVWLNLYRHGIERLALRDLYSAYYVSMHGEGLLTRGMGLLPSMPDYTGDPAVQQFIAEQKTWRDGCLQGLKKDPALHEVTSDTHLWTNFKLMEVFDQFAQFICNRYPFNSQARKNGPTNKLANVPVPLGPGKPDVTLTVDVQNETEAIVRPFPFDVSPLMVSFEGRLVPNRRYSNQDEFLGDFYKAQRIGINYTLRAA